MDTVPHREITHKIIGAAMRVYNTLGSGFNEAIYDKALGIAMEQEGLGFESQPSVEVCFESIAIGLYYPDYWVERLVVVELKAVGELNSTHIAQTINYLVSTGCSVGLLINFGTSRLEWKRVLPPMRVQTQRTARNALATDGRSN